MVTALPSNIPAPSPVDAGAQSNSKVESAKHGDARHGGRFIPDPTQRLQPP